MNKKLYVVGNQSWYADWVEGFDRTNDFREADLVFLTGGEDINPALYNCREHSTTYYNINRDARELAVLDNLDSDQKVFGTCRGLN